MTGNEKMNSFVIEWAGIKAIAQRKKVKYLRITVKPPEGQVYVSVPMRTTLATVRTFLEQKREWIAEKQAQCLSRAQMIPECTGDYTLLWGKRLPLIVESGCSRCSAALEERGVVLRLDQDSPEMREKLLDTLCREQLADRIPALAEKWEAIMKVSASQWRTRCMKTRWGSCNTVQGRIWLNVRLAMLTPECLEYVVVHELCHLHEPSHNARFRTLMDEFLPGWRRIRDDMKGMSGVLY